LCQNWESRMTNDEWRTTSEEAKSWGERVKEVAPMSWRRQQTLRRRRLHPLSQRDLRFLSACSLLSSPVVSSVLAKFVHNEHEKEDFVMKCERKWRKGKRIGREEVM
jgi:hypothetical protein